LAIAITEADVMSKADIAVSY